ncbi:cation diffusion facilitator family transporter [Mesorhizobium sp. J18]|uniref:cation diffusion facilitator family transporter n=1 Tax=Mesorhizobium sp. J18 TaxID=935263 RepID=UPI00119ABD12|nr:cation diffusion facilitator family transporter [Mesorhizobium sp. J18]TWG97150.1 cation diffusion facilitator family transporter [Mesorhizobium sp. J18]
MQDKVRRLAFWSIIVAFAVLGLKFAAWWLTGSVALFSDALESIVNVVASTVAFYAIGVSQLPPDANHPFGHHKAEYFSAVTEGVLIVVAALLIFREAALALIEPQPLDAPALGLAVNMVATALNAVWAWLLVSTGRRERSPALVADGKHLWSDVVTSAGVFAGLVLALSTGWFWLDPALAIVVAANILWQGWLLVRSSVQGLMDVALDDNDLTRIRRIVEENSGEALEFHDVKSREAGRARFLEFHLVVPSDMTVETSHEICDRIEDALISAMPGLRVTIHVEPAHKAKFN